MSTQPKTPLNQIVELLNAQSQQLARIERHQRARRRIDEAIDRRLTVIEESLIAVGRDAAQARATGHTLRGVCTALGVCTDLLLDQALEEKLDDGAIRGAQSELQRALDGKR